MDKQLDTVRIEVLGKSEGISTTGIPFSKGQLTSLDQLKLCQANKEIENFSRVLSFWPDGSINWLNLGFFHSSSGSNLYELVISDKSAAINSKQPTAELQIETTEQEITVSSSNHQFIFNLESLSMESKFKQQQLVKTPLAGELLLGDKQKIKGKLDHWSFRMLQDINFNSNSAIELKFEGFHEHPTNKLKLQFQTLITLYAAFPFVKVETTIHNPNPAKHPNGIWDLGDEGSELFNAIIFDLELVKTDIVKYKASENDNWQTNTTHTQITQHASGGANWQSPAHVNKDNRVTLKTNGYEVSSNHIKVASGDRATPTLHSANGVGVTIEKFWENFPTSIEIDHNNLKIALFPTTDSPHELQGGEKKTHIFWLNLNGDSNDLNWVHSPPIAKPVVSWLTKLNALPTFSGSTEQDNIAKLIKAGIEHEQNFFAKREKIDEYGWRNFGDLYADHEALGYKGSDLYISHYNNQYDPIYGFIKQFLSTDDIRWYELADDLAKHVKDIDIYHTLGDKAEFNGGLFWHTDHYCKAYTSSHRSYSKLQPSDAYRNRLGGGGPGGQHCYTSGLTYHYFLSGSESSKEAVLTLEKWITHFYEGTGSCLELLLALKNRNNPGYKNHIVNQYPYDRGTAYYVIALLDCYQLTQDSKYIQRAEYIIQHTVHPSDDINRRDLPNVENCWFYTIFLQAICRYLELKETIQALDENFYYARDTLLHYAEWMVSNEYPYLEKPEILEFPNDTWTAQDLRKVHILAAAHYYSANSKPEFLDKANYFNEYIIEHLSRSKELSNTRIQVLLMQNHGALDYYISRKPPIAFEERRDNWPEAAYQNPPGLLFGFAKALGKRLLKLSVTNEINWLKTRLGK